MEKDKRIEEVKQIIFNTLPKSLGKDKKHQKEWLCEVLAKQIAEELADKIDTLYSARVKKAVGENYKGIQDSFANNIRAEIWKRWEEGK